MKVLIAKILQQNRLLGLGRDWCGGMRSGWRCGYGLGVNTGFNRRGLDLSASGRVDLGGGRLGSSSVWHTLHSAERRSTWHLADGRLSPALALYGDRGSSPEILIELVGALRVKAHCSWGRGRQATLAPCLGSVLVLRRPELAGSLGLLLERLLLLSVCEPDLDLELLAGALDGVIVEGLDDLVARVTTLKTVSSRSVLLHSCQKGMAYRAKPTPRPWPFLSRKMRDEQTLCGANRLASSCSFIDLGRLDT